MRKSTAFSVLFPTLRGEVVVAALTRPDRWWYLSELAHLLGTGPSSLQRELKALVQAGILERRREGTRVYFKADARSPLFPELRGLVEKSAGLLPSLQRALEPLAGRIDCAFVYGSIARGEEHSLSDVDLMTIGSVGLADLAPALRELETRLGREVNVTLFSRDEFREKVRQGDHFLSSVLRQPKEFVKGSQGDLEGIVGKSRRPTTSDVSKRNRRSPRARRSGSG